MALIAGNGSPFSTVSNTPWGPVGTMSYNSGNTLELPSLPTPPINPFGNIPGFANPSSGCNPSPGGYPGGWNPPPLNTGGGQRGVCWWCNPSGGLPTQPQQPINIFHIPPPPPPVPPPPIIPPPIIPGPTPPPPIPPPPIQPQPIPPPPTGPITDPRQNPITPFPILIPTPGPGPSGGLGPRQQQPIITVAPLPIGVTSKPPPIVAGPPVTPIGGGGKQPINVIPGGGVDLPPNILLPGGIGPTVGPFPAWSYNPQTNTLTMPKLRLGPIHAGPAGTPSFGSVPSPGLPGGVGPGIG